ncbi:MAG: hypothetical protein RR450_03660 [Oscillospiraceae bacterium]
MSQIQRDLDIRVTNYGPKKLNNQHHEILRRSLCGQSHKAIANSLGITAETVGRVLGSPVGREKGAILHAEADYNAIDIAKEIRALAPKALEIMESLMDNETNPAAVRLRAATDLLDRAGHGAVKKLDVRATNFSLSKDDVEEIKRVALERMENLAVPQ